MHCMYCGMPVGTCWAEVMSKKFKPIALAVIEIHLSEGISQAGSQSVLKALMGWLYLTNTAKAP